MILHHLSPLHAPSAADGDVLLPAAADKVMPLESSTIGAALPSTIEVPAAVRAIADECAAQLRQHLKLALFGFDLIRACAPTPIGEEPVSTLTLDGLALSCPLPALPAMPSRSGSPSLAPAEYFLIDINYFPSYKTLSNLTTKLLRLCLRHRIT
jgi:hypothetical protein